MTKAKTKTMALVQMAPAASVTVTFGELRTNGERTE
jgi:hypothetical protein